MSFSRSADCATTLQFISREALWIAVAPATALKLVFEAENHDAQAGLNQQQHTLGFCSRSLRLEPTLQKRWLRHRSPKRFARNVATLLFVILKVRQLAEFLVALVHIVERDLAQAVE